MGTFKLPDLGEGLAEAEIVQWHVAVGDTVRIEMKDDRHHSIFGAIEQTVQKYGG